MSNGDWYLRLEFDDWIADMRLTMCEPATRGIWIDLLLQMKREGTGGLLTGTLDQLARLTRSTESQFSAALDELAGTGAATVIDHSATLTALGYPVDKSVDNPVDKLLIEICPLDCPPKCPQKVRLCPANFTVMSRRILREENSRNYERLKKQRQRLSR